jgi:hypothetical protein
MAKQQQELPFATQVVRDRAARIASRFSPAHTTHTPTAGEVKMADVRITETMPKFRRSCGRRGGVRAEWFTRVDEIDASNDNNSDN